MTGKPGPRAPYPCDHCKDPVAPFGSGPPPALAIAVARPLWVCGAPPCRAWAAARKAALIAAHDPLTPARRDPATGSSTRPPDPAQGSLI